MSRTAVIVICIFSLVMSGIIIGGGYASWDAYKEAHSSEEIGNDILDGINDKAEEIGATAERFNNPSLLFEDLGSVLNSFGETLNGYLTTLGNRISGFFDTLGDRISNFFTTLWHNIRNWFRRAFSWLNGSDFDDDEDSTIGQGFGGGGGDAR